VRSTDGGAPQLLFRLPLNIEFDNGSVQTLPLEATVLVPSLRLSTESLDFGVCFVGQTRELHVLLSNPTGSRSFWHCRLGTFFSARCYACVHPCLCLCLFVTSRCSTKTAKRKITQTTPHDSPGTLVF